MLSELNSLYYTPILTRLTTDSNPEQFPSFSSDGTKIVFTRSNRVFVMNVDGSNVRKLTDAPGWDAVPPNSWSPDGTRIAYQENLGSTTTGIGMSRWAEHVRAASKQARFFFFLVRKRLRHRERAIPLRRRVHAHRLTGGRAARPGPRRQQGHAQPAGDPAPGRRPVTINDQLAYRQESLR